MELIKEKEKDFLEEIREERKKMVAIRSIIRAPKGHCLIAVDLSAAEAWVVAHLANDQNMIRELTTNTLHEYAASIIFDKPKELVTKLERYIGKKGNHSLNYRTSGNMLTISINKEGKISISLGEGKKYYEKWHHAFNVRQWWNEIDDVIKRTRQITTAYGRRRTFHGMTSDELLKAATAYEPQSTIGDHMYGAVHEDLGIEGGLLAVKKNITDVYKEIKLLNTSHDSGLWSCPNETHKEISERIVGYLKRPLIVKGQTFTIPVDCDIYPERWCESPDDLS